MELGQKFQDSGLTPAATSDSKEKNKVVFPSFSLRGDKMEEFLKECPDAKEVGYELTATVTLKVSGYRDDQYGKDLTLDVKSMDDLEDTDENEEANEAPSEASKESDDEEEKILGYKRPKVQKESYGASAKDME